MKKVLYQVGIDEVGRGPLAGPVMVGVVLLPANIDWSQIPGVSDSKKVSAKNRLTIFRRAELLKKEGSLDYEVAAVSAKRIDKIGIAPAIKEALEMALESVTTRAGVHDLSCYLIKLDGGLKAPNNYLNQETIIKGDAKEPSIGLASIIAKVTRDTYMERLAKKNSYVNYGFLAHKGYGTAKHREAIARYGLSSEHRTSFCRNIKK